MNVLLYSKYSTYSKMRVGGAETSIRLLGEKLAERGHNVFYLTLGEHAHNDLELQNVSGVTLLLYPEFSLLPFARLKKKVFGKRAKRKWFQEMLLSVLNRFSIDVVYTYYDMEAVEAFLVIKRLVGTQLVVRMAGLKWYEESVAAPRLKARYERMFNDADCVNYNTPSLKTLCIEKANEIGFSLSPKVEFVGDIGAAVDFEVPKIVEKKTMGVLSLVVATRFSSYQKRQDLLIRGLALIEPDVKVNLLMVGDGPTRTDIEDLVVEMNLGGNVQVKIVPFMKQDDLWQVLSNADALCHPCEYEGLSKIIVESMLIGLPIIASEVIPLGDYLCDGETAMLVENTPEAWAEKIRWVYHNQQSLFSCSIKAQAFALSHFDPSRNVIGYEELFKDIIANSKAVS